MGKRHIFLPLMVQMVNVGEKTGNLGSTLSTVADSFEMEADDKTSAAIGLIQPALTIGIAVVVGFIAVAMLSTMYGITASLMPNNNQMPRAGLSLANLLKGKVDEV